MKTSFPKQDIKVLLLEGVSRTAVADFQAAGYSNIEYHEKALPEAELARSIADAHLVGIRSRTQLTSEILAQARRLIGVGCFCIDCEKTEAEVMSKSAKTSESFFINFQTPQWCIFRNNTFTFRIRRYIGCG